MPQRLERGFNGGHVFRGDRLRGFAGERRPDVGEVGFGRVGQAEGERSANSFLPRSMIRAL